MIQKPERVKFRASFSYENKAIGVISKLNFKLASYDLEGNFLGFEDLTDQLVICNRPSEELERIYNIGTTVEIMCTYDLSVLVSQNENLTPRKANNFYELFLEDYNGNMIDVPVLVENIQRDGVSVNRESTKPNDDWVLTRRFYLFDTVSGVERTQPDKIAYISYARYLKLVINLDQEAEEMINVPYLKIDYRQRTYEFITQDNALTRLQFSSEYVLDTEGFWKVGGAIFWVFFVFFILILTVVTCCKFQVNMLESNSLDTC